MNHIIMFKNTNKIHYIMYIYNHIYIYTLFNIYIYIYVMASQIARQSKGNFPAFR